MRTRATDRSLAAAAAQVGDRLRARGQTLVTAESCTGGWIAKAVTDVTGSSAWFLGAFVTYSDAMKMRHLAVAAGSLQSDGAVSEAVVRQMAAGARKAGGADWALAVSGVAGPDGGSAEKPVGLVWFGFEGPARAWCVHRNFRGGRKAVRRAAVLFALNSLSEALLAAGGGPPG